MNLSSIQLMLNLFANKLKYLPKLSMRIESYK